MNALLLAALVPATSTLGQNITLAAFFIVAAFFMRAAALAERDRDWGAFWFYMAAGVCVFGCGCLTDAGITNGHTSHAYEKSAIVCFAVTAVMFLVALKLKFATSGSASREP